MTPVIDVHTHLFSALDIPIEGYLSSRRHGERLLGSIFWQVFPGPRLVHYLAERLREECVIQLAQQVSDLIKERPPLMEPLPADGDNLRRLQEGARRLRAQAPEEIGGRGRPGFGASDPFFGLLVKFIRLMEGGARYDTWVGSMV
ncbi:MAG: hypothetical protein JXA74_07275, partial [Anaerolineae bacterium]|nr:hypothetical protein [Anaerolineae bacterium]